MGSISPFNSAGLISEVSEEIATQIGKNCSRQTTPLSFECPHAPYISLAYIFVHDSMGLSSFKFVQ